MARRPKAAADGRPKAPLSALRPLLPFALRYRGRIVAGLIALVCASASTLVVPIAMRRVIDHGFTADGSDVIDAYFLALYLILTFWSSFTLIVNDMFSCLFVSLFCTLTA